MAVVAVAPRLLCAYIVCRNLFYSCITLKRTQIRHIVIDSFPVSVSTETRRSVIRACFKYVLRARVYSNVIIILRARHTRTVIMSSRRCRVVRHDGIAQASSGRNDFGYQNATCTALIRKSTVVAGFYVSSRRTTSCHCGWKTTLRKWLRMSSRSLISKTVVFTF